MKKGITILTVLLAICYLSASKANAQLGRCCFGSTISPACDMETEAACREKTTFQSWFADSNCVDHPCPGNEAEFAVVEMAYEGSTWNIGLDPSFEVEIWFQTTVDLCASSATFKPNRNIVTIDSVIWGDTLLEAFENDSIINILKVANDSLIYGEIRTCFVLGFVTLAHPIIPAITPTDDPILLATAYLSIKADSLGVIPPGDSILFSVDSVTIPPALDFLFTDLLGFSVCPEFAGSSVWIKNPVFLCGDCNADSETNISDAVWIINYIFTGGDAPQPLEAGDVNCDSICNISDAVWIINYVFIDGKIPCDTDDDGIPDC